MKPFDEPSARAHTLPGLACALTAVLPLVWPSHGPTRDPLAEGLRSALDAEVQALWSTWSELDRAGLLENRTVLVLPPLHGSKSNRATEAVAELVAKAQRPGASVVYGSGLRARLDEYLVPTSAYQAADDGVRVAGYVQAGFAVFGAVDEDRASARKSFSVQLRAQRPGSESYDYDGSRALILFGTAAYRPFQDAMGKAPAIPVGSNGGVRPVEIGDRQRQQVLDRQLAAACASFLAAADDAVEAGSLRAPVWKRSVALLPIAEPGGRASRLSDELARRLGFLLGPRWEPEDIDAHCERTGTPLGQLLEEGFSPSESAELGIEHALRVRYEFDGTDLWLDFMLQDGAGGFCRHQERLSGFVTAELIGELCAGDSRIEIEPYEPDGMELLRAAMEGSARALLEPRRAELAGRRLRLLPLETPSTAGITGWFGTARAQLRQAREEVARLADERDVPLEQALLSEQGEFPVVLALNGQEFESWEAARRTLMYYSWSNLQLSPEFQLGQRLNESIKGAILSSGALVDQLTQRLVPLEIERNDIRSRVRVERGADGQVVQRVDVASDISTVNLEQPDFALGFRLAALGSRAELTVELYDLASPATVAAWVRTEFDRRRARAVLAAVAPPHGSEPAPPVQRIELAPHGRDDGAATLAELRDCVGAVNLRVCAQGARGAELAERIAEILSTYPFDLKVAVERGERDWSAVAPRMDSPCELRFVAGARAAGAAAEALRALLERAGFLAPEERAALLLLRPAVRAVESLESLDLPPRAAGRGDDRTQERETLVLALRT